MMNDERETEEWLQKDEEGKQDVMNLIKANFHHSDVRFDVALAYVVIFYNFCHDEERRQLEQKTNKNIRIQIRTDPIRTEVWKESIQLLNEL